MVLFLGGIFLQRMNPLDDVSQRYVPSSDVSQRQVPSGDVSKRRVPLGVQKICCGDF